MEEKFFLLKLQPPGIFYHRMGGWGSRVGAARLSEEEAKVERDKLIQKGDKPEQIEIVPDGPV